MHDKTIVFVVNTLAIGGAAKMVSFAANSATKVFKNVYIVVYDDKESVHRLESTINVINLKLNNNITKENSGKYISSINNRLHWMKKIRATIKPLNPDVVMPFITDVIIDTFLAMLGHRAVYLASERGDPTSYPYKWKVLSKIVYPFYDSLVFQSEGARQYFGWITKKKSCLIENPYYSNREYVEPHQGIRKKQIVSAGRFVPEKGFNDLILAFSILYKKHANYSLVIYGEGTLRDELNKLIETLNLSKVVKLKGYVNNVPKEINDSEVFVLSSISEGIPNVLIEAMAIGMPVVAADCKPGGAASLIENGKNGILVPISSPVKIAEAIESLIMNKEYARIIGQEAIKIKEKLDPEIISRKWVDYFKSFA